MNTKLILPLIVFSLFFFLAAEGKTAPCGKRDPLFQIERNKNKNVVKYDACLLPNDSISKSHPFDVYWVLANGKEEKLNLLENNKAYGIKSKEKLGEDKFRIVLAGLNDRSMVIEKLDQDYKAVTQINGQSSILERVYVHSKEQRLGLPKVQYVDLFGLSLKTNRPVHERITHG